MVASFKAAFHPLVDLRVVRIRMGGDSELVLLELLLGLQQGARDDVGLRVNAVLLLASNHKGHGGSRLVESGRVESMK
jgi:hypothetical protein